MSKGKNQLVIVPYSVIVDAARAAKDSKAIGVYYTIMKNAKLEDETNYHIADVSLNDLLDGIGLVPKRGKGRSIDKVISAIYSLAESGVLIDYPDYQAMDRKPLKKKYLYRINIADKRYSSYRSAVVTDYEFALLKQNTGRGVRIEVDKDGIKRDDLENEMTVANIGYGVSFDNVLRILCLIRSCIPKEGMGLPQAITMTRAYMNEYTGINIDTVGDAVRVLKALHIIEVEWYTFTNHSGKAYRRTFFANNWESQNNKKATKDGAERGHAEIEKAVDIYRKCKAITFG